MIEKEDMPGAAAEYEWLYECSLGLDGVIQVVSGPGIEQFS